MHLKHMSPQQLEDLHLPDEALAALARGDEWEYTPDSAEGTDADVSWCDDCGTWHQTWTVWGLRLDADGTLYETECSVDTDGDWSGVGEYAHGTFNHDLDNDQRKERWKSYSRWVIDNNGEDPIGEFFAESATERVALARRALQTP